MKTNKVIDTLGNPETIGEMLYKCKKYRERKNTIKIGLLGIDFRYSSTVSNAHSCPINGVTNWHRDPVKPKGYDGWYGRVWLAAKSLKPSEGYSDSDQSNLQPVYIYTGTGGAGLYLNPFITKQGNILAMEEDYSFWSWDARIYTDDWPFLQDMHKELLIRRALDPSEKLPNFVCCIGELS